MTKSSERIEQEIDGIRDRMRNRIDEAARDFSPRAVASRVTGKPDPSSMDLVDWAVTKARSNPIATGLIAAGLVGFAAQSSERSRIVSRSDVERGKNRVRGYANEASQTVRGYAHDAADIAVEKADDARHYISESTHSARQAISRSAHEAEEAARHAADRTLEYGRDGTEWVKRNPTATGLFALAVGAAAASVFAARRRDDYVRDQILTDEDGENVVRKSVDQAKRATGKAKAKAKTGAGTMKAKAEGAVSSVKRTTAKKPRKSASAPKTAAEGAVETARKARATRAVKEPREPSELPSVTQAKPVMTDNGPTSTLKSTPAANANSTNDDRQMH